MTDHPTVPLDSYREYPIEEMRERIERFYADMARRRTVREFSDRPVPRDIIETALKTAGTARSGWLHSSPSAPTRRSPSSRRRRT